VFRQYDFLEVYIEISNNKLVQHSIKNPFIYSQDGERRFYNVEMGPPKSPSDNASRFDISTTNPGDHLFHFNKYMHLNIEQENGFMIEFSDERMKTFDSFNVPKNRADVIQMLGEEETVFFRDNVFVKTIAVGIFDCSKKTLSLYSDNPKCNEPLVVLPLVIKDK
jgi:hypothetical protein